MFRIYQVTLLAVCIQTGLSTFATSQDLDVIVRNYAPIFNHSDWAKTKKCATCHQPFPQWLSRSDSNTSASDLLLWTELSDDRKYFGQDSVEGVRCGEYLVSRLGDTLLRTHLRLKEREALVVVKSPATESDSLSLEQGDVILAADGQIIGDAMLFRNKMDQNPKSKVELTLIREGKEISRTVAASDLCSPPKVYRIGVQVEPPSEALRSQLSLTANEGLIVLEVTEDSPAKASGVEVHDILMQVDQSQLSTFDDLKESINKSRGNEVQLRLVRKGKPMTLRVKPIAEQESEDRAFMLQLNRESKSNCPALRGHIMEVPASKP